MLDVLFIFCEQEQTQCELQVMLSWCIDVRLFLHAMENYYVRSMISQAKRWTEMPIWKQHATDVRGKQRAQ